MWQREAGLISISKYAKTGTWKLRNKIGRTEEEEFASQRSEKNL